jgi:hypothetical protein
VQGDGVSLAAGIDGFVALEDFKGDVGLVAGFD